MFLLKPVRIWPCTEIGLAFSVPSGDRCTADENLCLGGGTEWENSLVSHLVSNAWFAYLLLGWGWPRRQQWYCTSRCRASLCFSIWKIKSHNVMKDNKQRFFRMFVFWAVQDAGLGPSSPPRKATTLWCTLGRGSRWAGVQHGVLAFSGWF